MSSPLIFFLLIQVCRVPEPPEKENEIELWGKKESYIELFSPLSKLENSLSDKIVTQHSPPSVK